MHIKKKGQKMRKLLVTTALVFTAGSAMAAELGGEISVDIAETAAGDWGATTSFDLGIASMGSAVPAFGVIELDMDEEGDITLDEWKIGTVINGDAVISIGDQGNIWLDRESDAAHATTADPAMKESVQVTALGASMAIGFTDVEADVTDIENVQGKYEMGVGANINVAAAGDYNMNSEEWTIGGRAEVGVNDMFAIGQMVTYGSADEKIGYESDISAFGVTAYLNGDADELAQNVGGSYTYDLNGIELGAGVNYNIDTEATTPSVSASFAF